MNFRLNGLLDGLNLLLQLIEFSQSIHVFSEICDMIIYILITADELTEMRT